MSTALPEWLDASEEVILAREFLEGAHDAGSVPEAAVSVQMAQVHATLALVAVLGDVAPVLEHAGADPALIRRLNVERFGPPSSAGGRPGTDSLPPL